MVTPICSGKLSVFPDNESVGFYLQDVLPDGPTICAISRKDTRMLFSDYSGFVGRLNDQDAAYRFFAAEGGEWRFLMTSDFLIGIHCEIDHYLQQKYKKIDVFRLPERLHLIFLTEDNATHGAADIREYLDKTCPLVPTTVKQEALHVFLYVGGES